MKAHEEVNRRSLLTSVALPREGNTPGTHSVQRWEGPKAGLDVLQEINLLPVMGIEP